MSAFMIRKKAKVFDEPLLITGVSAGERYAEVVWRIVKYCSRI
jgi:hypothetical protein